LPLMAPLEPSLAATEVLAPPTWVTTENGVALQRLTDANTKLPSESKTAKKIFDQGLELASKAVDEEIQVQNDKMLENAEGKFSLLIDELAPEYAYGYTNRANVRVARGNLLGAIADYGRALELAPLAKDAWVTQLNLGSTLLAIERPSDALRYLQRSVDLSKGDRYTLLGRSACYDALGQYEAAVGDYAAVLEKYPGDVQPWWLRYSLDLAEVGRRPEAVGLARRLAAKFDIEPETTLSVCSLLWRDGTETDREEALRRWKFVPQVTKDKMLAFDVAKSKWPPRAVAAAAQFRDVVRAPAGEPTG